MAVDPRYLAIVKEWERVYGKSRFQRYDLTEARLCCVKCGKLKSKMSRHHISNDFFFAQMLPAEYARRYIEFRKDDCAKLCDDCHKDIHAIYKRITEEVWIELHRGGQRIITVAWCEHWKGIYRQAFEIWIAKPIHRRKRKRKSKRV
jgi:hypothetical protein